jgi:hypothetical protein
MYSRRREEQCTGLRKLNYQKKFRRNKITNVEDVSSFRKNLIFVGMIIDIRSLVIFLGEYCWILDRSNHFQIITVGHRDVLNGLYNFERSFEVNLFEREDQQNLWNKLYGHLSRDL